MVEDDLGGKIGRGEIEQPVPDQEGFPGPAESTLAAREAVGFKGTKSLIVTGQLRNAITFVVREG